MPFSAFGKLAWKSAALGSAAQDGLVTVAAPFRTAGSKITGTWTSLPIIPGSPTRIRPAIWRAAKPNP